MFNLSTVGRASPRNFVCPPATARWVGVVATAGLARLVGIGGRTSSHSSSVHRVNSELVLLLLVSDQDKKEYSSPPIVVSLP